jgi:purine nucleosidase
VSDLAPRRIIIDTDPGVDDSMAVLLAFRSPEVSIEGLTTVFGNSDTQQTTANALRLVELAGRPEVPVARGAEKPLMRPFTGQGWRFHGRNGLGEVDFAPPRGQPVAHRAAQFIAETVMANPGEITLVPLGPLTNIALAFALEPRIAENVREVVFMGGSARRGGNASPVAEANIHNDPEAAHIVFHAGWPLTMVGLDVTQQSVITAAYMDELQASGDPFTDFICAIVPHYMSFHRDELGLSGFPVHDSSALAYVIWPSLFKTEKAYVDVECISPHHAGQTVADWRGQRGIQPNVDVCVNVEGDSFLQCYKERITGRMG